MKISGVLTKRAKTWGLIGAGVALAIVVFYPHQSAAIPEWRIQVIDEKGRAVVGVDVHQEWIDLEADGMVYVDTKRTDANGWVNLPARQIRDSLALRILDYVYAHHRGRKSLLSTHAFVCWQEQTGEILWDDEHPKLDHRLQLRQGSCPYG